MNDTAATAMPQPYTTDDFTHDALMIRTTDAKARAHGGFVWPREIGAVVLPARWDPAPTCGNGLHGLLDGIGDNDLMSRDPDALWWVVGVVRSEVVKIDDAKVKVPRAKVLYCGHMPGAYAAIIGDFHKALMASAATTGYRASAATTGDYASAATTGNGASAATTGYRASAATTGNGASAATTGDYASAATTGDYASAATTGNGASAATTGDGASAATTGNGASAATTGKHSIAAALGCAGTAKAEEGGAIVLACWSDDGELLAVRAAMVGQDGVEPGIDYRLTRDGAFEAVSGGEAA